MDSASLSVTLTALQTPVSPLSEGQLACTFQFGKLKLAPGSGLNEVNQVFGDVQTIAGSGNKTYDLNAFGGAKDALGNAYALTRVVVLAVENTSTDSTAILTLESAASDGFAPLPAAGIPIPPGGVFLLAGPSAAAFVVGATSGGIKLVNGSSTASATFEIFVLGS